MPELRPSVSSRRLGLAILLLLLVRIASLPAGNILDVGQASSLGAWRLLHGLHLYGAVSWPGPAWLRLYRPDTYGPFAYYAYIPFVAIFPPAPALAATLLPALCLDALTLPHAALVARPMLAAALVLLALSPLLRPPVQEVREHAALAAALLIGAQLLLGYWFYSYLTWCYPLLIIAMIRARPDQEAAGTEAHDDASAADLAETAVAWCGSAPGGGAEDLRSGGERHLSVRGGQLVDPVDGEPGPLDSQARVPAAVAAADQPWPDGGVQGLLDPTPPGGAGLDVFEEPQFAAGLEDTADLGERLVLVGDAAQDEGGDRDVEEGVVAGQVAGGTVDDLDRDGGLRGVGLGDGPQVGFRLDRDHLGDRGRVVGEVEAVAGSDFDHPSGHAADERLAAGSDTLFHEEACAGVPAGEEGVAVAHGVLP